MDEIKISMVAPAIVYFPALIAQRRGQFTANGIVATTEVTGATDKVTSALKANDCQVAMVTPEGGPCQRMSRQDQPASVHARLAPGM